MNLLLALDFGDVLKALVPLLFVILWVIGQLAGQERPDRKAPRKKAAKPQRRPGGGPLSQEIEAFLKRAADQRGGKPAREIEVLKPQPAGRDKPAPRKAVAAQAIPRRAVKMPSDTKLEQPRADLRERHFIGDLVERHLPSQRFSDHTSHLGELAGTADTRMDVRIHGKFDHRLGSLAGSSDRDVTDAAIDIATSQQPADAIRRLLQTDAGVRQAVILSEILTPPAHRW